jgi:uncharacterized protein (DUF488 family)
MAEILTVGHSTHAIEAFIRLLEGAEIELVADVRRYPGSRRNPQFGAEALARSLGDAGIGYEPFGESLGGRREGKAVHAPGPPDNSAWRNSSFRAYADYMSSPEFAAGIEVLERIGRERRTALMCAEAHPSRCHRRLIADWLVAHDWRVVHLLPDGRREQHSLTPEAVVEDGRVSYPAPQPSLGI